MEEGPPKPPIIGRFQTTLSCWERKQLVVSVKEKACKRQVSVGKMNESEPYDEVSRRFEVSSKSGNLEFL
jgi:hypothetical protein